MVEPISTIITAIHIVNALFRVFRKITSWLKSRFDAIWQEDNRILKILRAYFDRNKNGNEVLPEYIRHLVIHMNSKRRLEWMDIPGADEAAEEADDNEQYDEPGYTTDIESDQGGESDGDGSIRAYNSDEEQDDEERYQVDREGSVELWSD